MRIALAQLNPTVGDIRGNVALVQSAAERACAAGAELLVASELVVSGYPPKDLLLREGFVEACDRAVEELAKSVPGDVGVLVGHPSCWNVPAGRVANAASLLEAGRVRATIHKTLLPNYDVFDEQRYFRPADAVAPVEFRGRRLGVHICEDAWWGQPMTTYHTEPAGLLNPVDRLAVAGAQVMINLSASPFELDKPGRRTGILREHVERHPLPFLFVNQVGGNDDLVFDGHSMVIDAAGSKVVQMADFAEDFEIVDLDRLPQAVSKQSICGAGVPPAGCSRDGRTTTSSPRPAAILDALVLGLGDYMRKCGFTDCVLGLSGGIDSALACYIASQAAGPQHVHGLLMPSRYSTPHSVDDARRQAETLGIDYEIIPIDDVHRAYEQTAVVGDDLTSEPAGLADQNLQARIRGAMVMTRSNRHGWMALATGNKSELAVGYCTLYGDMCGGFAVLADVFKRDVYAVARYVNEVRERREAIPQNIINKAPSAELAPDQFDQDVLPPYDLLDDILEGLIEQEASVATLSRKFPPETVAWVAGRLDRNEFKRRQMPPGIKLSARAFGSGRRMPMAARFEIR